MSTRDKLLETGIFTALSGERTIYLTKGDLGLFDTKRETPCGIKVEVKFEADGEVSDVVVRTTMPWEKYG